MTNADHDRAEEPRGGGLVKRVFAQGSDPEERLEAMLAERRSELDAHAERLRESIEELERREELLRDSRASVERMLRLGTTELEARESELSEYLRALTERETALATAEQDLAVRREELGAVELKRAAVERRERLLAGREEELAERETQVAEGERAKQTRVEVELALVPGAQYQLVELDPTQLTAGHSFDVGDETFVVVRVGPSPLPHDARRCAYLVRGNRVRESATGSS